MKGILFFAFISMMMVSSFSLQTSGEFVGMYFSAELKPNDYFKWEVVDQRGNYSGIYEVTILKTPSQNYANFTTKSEYTEAFQDSFNMTKDSSPYLPDQEDFLAFIFPTNITTEDGKSGIKEVFFPYIYNDVNNENSNWSVTEDGDYLLLNASVIYDEMLSSIFFMKIHSLTGVNVYSNFTVITAGIAKYTTVKLIDTNKELSSSEPIISNIGSVSFPAFTFLFAMLPLVLSIRRKK